MAGVTDARPLTSLSGAAAVAVGGWAIDKTGQPIVEFDAEAHREWCAKWAPPCPVGNPQRLRRPLGFPERNVGELELRVPFRLDQREGACQVIVDERDGSI